MRFGEIGLDDAIEAVLAHSTKVEGATLKKGRRLNADDVARLRDAGHSAVIAAKLDPGDVDEDSAARRIAQAMAGARIRVGAPFTGRANLYAECDGVVTLDRDRIETFNRVDAALTVATVMPYQFVRDRQMLATIKVIPFAVPLEVLDRGCAGLSQGPRPAIAVAPLRARTAVVIQTRLEGTRESVLDKTSRLLADRLRGLRCEVVKELRCPHRAEAVGEAIAALWPVNAELTLIVGASAIVDRLDVIPAAIAQAGGRLVHFGMPVDPGNLLLTAELDGRPVLGLPGCARSPKYNGLDQVLERLMTDLPVGPGEITAMGVGGLLKEFADRPQPRRGGEAPEPAAGRAPVIAAIVLAAGQSRRMGRLNKMTVEVDGRAMVARVVDEVIGSGLRPFVVVGHQPDAVRGVLAGRAVTFVDSADYASGLSASLRAGVRALGDDVEGVVVCLADMPLVRAGHIRRLVAAFDPVEGRAICVPTFDGKRGNPVLFARELFAEIEDVRGDVGARHLIGEHEASVCEVPMDDRSVLVDIDSPQALDALRGGVDADA